MRTDQLRRYVAPAGFVVSIAVVIVCVGYAFTSPAAMTDMLSLFGGERAYVKLPLAVIVCQLVYFVLNLPVFIALLILEQLGLGLTSWFSNPTDRAIAVAASATVGSALWWSVVAMLLRRAARRLVNDEREASGMSTRK
jgi:hypothetical protein